MGPAPRPVGSLIAHLLGVALFAWLYGGDLALWLKVQAAPVAAVADPPGLFLTVLALVVGAGGAALMASGWLQGRGVGWRGYRLFPIAAIALLFVDLAVLSSVRLSIPPADRGLIAVQALADAATALTVEGRVPADPRPLEPLLGRLGPVPWHVRGTRPDRWLLEVRTCDGPAGDAGGRPPGTLLYCAAPDRSRAWVTVVGLPPGQRFGDAPVVVSTDAAWVGTVSARAPAEPEEVTEEGGELLPTPPEEADSGR